ncbi:MAG TPA: ABC transporter permease [Acidimicrobiales bacterium]|nr:ABC transporter permease [Acidimicrobiales bacterium]
MSTLFPFIIVGLVSGSVYGIAALGLVLSYRTSGIFNFAQGAIAAVAAGLFYELHDVYHWNWGLAGVVTLVVVGVVLGLVMERVGYLLTGASTSMKIVATIGIMVSLIALFQVKLGAGNQTYPAFLPTSTFSIGGVFVGWDQVTIMALGLLLVLGLAAVLRFTTFGRETKAVVDDVTLLELSGVSGTSVRRRAWILSCMFGALSGVLIAPSLGLDATSLTLLVVESFGAAAIGRFVSLPWAYVGSLAIGVVGAVSTKYANTYSVLNGLPSSLPFLVLLVVLVFSRRGKLVEFGAMLQTRTVATLASPQARAIKMVVAVAVLCTVPFVFDTRIFDWSMALVYVILFMSLSLLVRTANQVSLCQMSFAAIGAVVMHHLVITASMPWLLALLVSGLALVPIGALIAIPALRISTLYVALATLGFGLLLEQQVFPTFLMFGNAVGTLDVTRPSFAPTATEYYFVVLACVLVIYFLVRAVERGALGRLLQARADAPVALTSLGSDVRIPGVLVFCLSAFVAGVAGALIGPIFGKVGPGDFQTVPTSLLLVVLLVLGAQAPGVGTLGAAIVAAIGIEVIPSFIGSYTTQNWLNLAFGVFAVQAAATSTGLRRRRQSRAAKDAAGGPDRPPASPTPVVPAPVAPLRAGDRVAG